MAGNVRNLRGLITDLLFKDNPGTHVTIQGGTELLRSRIVDSLQIVEMIFYIEETFSIHFGEEDLVEENLNTIDNIVRFVEKKIAERS